MLIPMDAFTRRLALKGAAKVALGSLFVGCGGAMVADPDVHPLPDAKVADGASDAAVEAATPDAALACLGPTEVDAGGVTGDEFACCLGVVEEVTGDAGLQVVDAATIAADPSLDNCCKAILAHVGSAGGYSEAIPTLPSCCGANGYPMGAACTPWGPPSPPEMEVA